MNLDAAATCAKMGIPAQFLPLLQEEWEAAMAEYPPVGAWMSPAMTEALATYCLLDETGRNVAVAAARELQAAEPARRFAWLCHWRLVKRWPHFKSWPGEDDVQGIGRLYLLAALSVIPKIREVHAGMGIPDGITRDTTLVITSLSRYHQVAHDTPGILNVQLHWLRNHIAGMLFRIVRMEFMLGPAVGVGTALRSRRTGEVLLFAPDGVAYDRNGYLNGTGESFDEQGWKSSFAHENGQYCGNVISPHGFALNRPRTLDAAEWLPELVDGEQVLDMHIPAGGNMTLDLCRDSIQKGFNFFARFFPSKPVKAVLSKSWIFNTQFEERLPDSNLARFMRELYLFPVESTGNDGVFFVFCREHPDRATAPRNTSLQKTMLDILERGGKLRSGGMVFLKNDLPWFGTQFYRSRFNPI